MTGESTRNTCVHTFIYKPNKSVSPPFAQQFDSPKYLSNSQITETGNDAEDLYFDSFITDILPSHITSTDQTPRYRANPENIPRYLPISDETPIPTKSTDLSSITTESYLAPVCLTDRRFPYFSKHTDNIRPEFTSINLSCNQYQASYNGPEDPGLPIFVWDPGIKHQITEEFSFISPLISIFHTTFQ